LTKSKEGIVIKEASLVDLAVLPRVKMYPNFAAVRLEIMKVNDELCTETFLGNLIAYVPSKDDDLKKMEKYQKETPEVCEELDIPEQFIIEVSIDLNKIHLK
jgi:hypothetical protein